MPRSASRRSRNTRPLRLESLERRQMMAYDIDFDNGILTIEGGAADDAIQIFLSDDGDEVEVTIRDTQGNLLADYDRDVEDVDLIQVFAFEGHDYIDNDTSMSMIAYGGEGSDYIQGGSGDDMLYGEAGNDSLHGRGGDNWLDGGDGHDYLAGGMGNDTLIGGGGVNDLQGGFGNDTYLIERIVDSRQRILDYGGSDTLDFSLYSTGIELDMTRDFRDARPNVLVDFDRGSIENLVGTAYDDILTGNALRNTIWGGAGDDLIGGGDGNDTLVGGEGNDRLDSGGVDSLFGGEGIDWFDDFQESEDPIANLVFTPPKRYRDWGKT